jgi:hypothetical protein
MWYLFNGDSRKSKECLSKGPFLTPDDARQSGGERKISLYSLCKIAQHYVTFEMFDENMEALQVLDQAIRGVNAVY